MALTLKREGIKVGTTLFLVDTHRKCDITINKVGRKWAYYGNRPDQKINLETMTAYYELGVPPQLYDSESAYQDAQELDKIKRVVRSAFTGMGQIQYRLPMSAYQQIYKILQEHRVEEKS